MAARVVARVPTGTAPDPKAAPADARERDDDLRGDPSQRHPDLVRMSDDYQEMRDCRAGATTIKAEGQKYLPMPDGFRAQNDGGAGMYESYKKRAQFPDIVSPTVLGMVGIVHSREAQIEGLEEGSALEYLWEKATPDGLPLEVLHRMITEEILTLGRVALFADPPAEGGEPLIALYKAESLINWSDSRDFFVLEESYRIRTGFSWDDRTRYRVLRLVDDRYVVVVLDKDGTPQTVGSAEDTEDQEDRSTEASPVARGGQALEEIPLVVAGSRDLSLEPDEMPLIGVARAATAIYRLDADYRHQLFMAGQETLFVSGLDVKDAPDFVGAGVIVCLPENASAQYVGPSGEGIDSHKTAIDDEREVAAAAGSRVFETGQKGQAESGDALRIRARAGTATLVSVALSSAAALERILRHCATMVGADPESIVVTPNLDFVDAKMTPDEAAKLMELWLQGVISYDTLYENLQRGEIASQERTAEEEQDLVAQEQTQTTDDEGGAGVDDETDEDAEGEEDPETAAYFSTDYLDA